MKMKGRRVKVGELWDGFSFFKKWEPKNEQSSA